MNSRNYDVLERIINYCREINETSEHFGRSEEILRRSYECRFILIKSNLLRKEYNYE